MKLDAVVVGAGFAGIYMLHRLREAGLSVRLIEAGADVGGAWYWNRYPGLRCDVPSLDYQYRFSEELHNGWRWPERYSEGPVIQRYLSYVADRLGLREHIQFETRVEAAAWDEAAHRWSVKTDRGETLSARYLLPAVGPLTVVNMPAIPGLEDFAGRIHHTARWGDKGADFTGRDVAVIGTGSSGVQCIPVIAKTAKCLTVYQRTPAYSLPVTNPALSDADIEAARLRFAEDGQERLASWGGMTLPHPPGATFDFSPEEREAEFERRWGMGGFAFLASFTDLMVNPDANAEAANFVRRKIREKVNDPAAAAILTSQDFPLGAKRPCLDTGYYETFNEPHVSLVDVRANPIERFTREGIVAGGVERRFDDVVLATGFDAMTGALLKLNVTGRNGVALGDVWVDGPRTYLSAAVAGFPNMFILAGPASPSIMSNAPAAAEQQVDWVINCITHMETNGVAAIEAEEAAQDEWTQHVEQVAQHTLYPRANSWIMGANIPGKPRLYMAYLGGLNAYRDRCTGVAAAGYKGFRFEQAAPGEGQSLEFGAA